MCKTIKKMSCTPVFLLMFMGMSVIDEIQYLVKKYCKFGAAVARSSHWVVI